MRETESGYNPVETVTVESGHVAESETAEQNHRKEWVDFLLQTHLHSAEELDGLSDQDLEALYIGTKDLLSKAESIEVVEEDNSLEGQVIPQGNSEVLPEKPEHKPYNLGDVAERIAEAKNYVKKKPYAAPSDLKAEMKKLLEMVEPQWQETDAKKRQVEQKGVEIVQGLGFDPKESIEAYNKLESVLNILPEKSYKSRAFKPSKQRELVFVRPDKIIEYNPAKPENELHDALIQALGVESQEEKSRLDYVAKKIQSEEDSALRTLKENVEHVETEPTPVETEVAQIEQQKQGEGVHIGSEPVEQEVLDFEQLKPKEEVKETVDLKNFAKLTDALKHVLKDRYSTYMRDTLKIDARNLNKLQDMTVSEFKAFFNHDEISPMQKRELQGLADLLNENVDGSKKIKDFLIESQG